MLTKVLYALLLLAISPVVSLAATIQPNISGIHQIAFHALIGQSFTAEDARSDIAFRISAINAGQPTASIEATIFAGSGAGGSTIDSVSVAPPQGFNGYYTVFESLSLVVGNVYTVLLDSPGSAYWGVGSGGDSYAGGTGFIGGVADNSRDFGIRVSAAAPVPMPASGILIIAALGTLAGLRKRHRS